MQCISDVFITLSNTYINNDETALVNVGIGGVSLKMYELSILYLFFQSHRITSEQISIHDSVKCHKSISNFFI